MTRLGVSAALVDATLVDGDIDVVDDRVVDVGLDGGAGSGIAAPGFVDLQVNGFAGIDLVSADPAGYGRVGEAMAATGVTAYQPTFITDAADKIASALACLADLMTAGPPGPRVLGAHLEGPFLSRQRAGTHPLDRLLEPDLEWVERMLAAGPVSQVTLAPELPGASAVIDRLVAAGVVVACGHTDADADAAHAAFDRGARAVTHLFNAMRPLHHRDPGIIGVALSRDEVTVPVIADGIHLAPEVTHLVWAATRRRFALVTDATAAATCPDGRFELGEVALTKDGLQVRRPDGTLAGSALTMDAAVRNAVDAGIPLPAALDAASGAPSRLLGRDDLGHLRPGAEADVVVLDDNLDVVRVLRAGQEIA